MTTEAIIAIAVGTLVQAIIGYVWKRSIEDKDAKIDRLSARVDDLDNEKVAKIREEVDKGVQRRAEIYRRLDQHDIANARTEERVKVLEETLPTLRAVVDQMARISERVEATTATLDRLVHQQSRSAEKLASLEATLEARG